MRYLLITVVLLSLCIVGCSNGNRPDNPKYSGAHKLWRFKKDVLYNDTGVTLQFKDHKITYLDLTRRHSLRFSFDDGQSFTSDYGIAGDTIFMQRGPDHARYQIVDFNVSKLGIVKFSDDSLHLSKRDTSLIEIVFEPGG
jgi:hypothetical protein